MATYNVSVTQSIVAQPANIAAAESTTFAISNPLSASSYFTLETVKDWAREYVTCQMALLCGGPPCQGASGLNSSRLGPLRDSRSSWAFVFQQLRIMVQDTFCRAKVMFPAESVAPMDTKDRLRYSESFHPRRQTCNDVNG